MVLGVKSRQATVAATVLRVQRRESLTGDVAGKHGAVFVDRSRKSVGGLKLQPAGAPATNGDLQSVVVGIGVGFPYANETKVWIRSYSGRYVRGPLRHDDAHGQRQHAAADTSGRVGTNLGSRTVPLRLPPKMARPGADVGQLQYRSFEKLLLDAEVIFVLGWRLVLPTHRGEREDGARLWDRRTASGWRLGPRRYWNER